MPSSKESQKKGANSFSKSSVNDKVKSMTGGSKASEVASKVSEYASMAAKVPFIGSMAAPLASGAAAASSVLDMFGFTREAEQMTPNPFVYRPYSNVANMNANDTSEIAALDVANSVTIDPTIISGSGEDPSSFASLFKRPTLIKTFTWEGTANPGDVLFSIPVTPFYTSLATATTAFTLTTAGFTGLPFQYWRGSMTYIVMVPTSVFHRGALQIAYSPQSVITTSDLTNVTYNRIMEIASQTVIEVEVGYVDHRPCLDSVVLSDSQPTIVSDSTHNGFLVFSVVTPLTGPTVASSETTICIFAYTSQMSFGVPKVVEWVPRDGGNPDVQQAFWSSYEMFAGVLGDEEETAEVEKLVPSTPYDCKAVLWGEEVDSCRALMQKFVRIPSEFVNAVSNIQVTGLIPVPHFPVMPKRLGRQADVYGANTISETFISFENWYVGMFVGIAGSSRYKVINSTQQSGVSTYTDKPDLAISIFNAAAPRYREKLPFPSGYKSDLAPTWVVQNGEAVEVTVPYYGHKKFYYTELPANCNPAAFDTADKALDVIQVFQNSNQFPGVGDDVLAYITIFRAMGPDLRLGQFIGTPRIQWDPNASTVTPWL